MMTTARIRSQFCGSTMSCCVFEIFPPPKRFRAALGCIVVRRRDDLGLVHLRAGASMIDLVSVSVLGQLGGAAPGSEGRNVDHVCLRVEPFDVAAIDAHRPPSGSFCGRTQANFGAESVRRYLTDPAATRSN
jgi:hypothetical protein